MVNGLSSTDAHEPTRWQSEVSNVIRMFRCSSVQRRCGSTALHDGRRTSSVRGMQCMQRGVRRREGSSELSRKRVDARWLETTGSTQRLQEHTRLAG